MRANRNRGIRSLADLESRCEITDCKCWLWQGGYSNGRPQVVFRFEEKKHAMCGRRAAMILAGKNVAGKECIATGACRDPEHCISPWHTQAISHRVRMNRLAAAGVFRNNVRKIDAGRRFAKRKLAPAQVSAIRALEGHATHKQVAMQFGVSSSTIGDIWRGNTHKAQAMASVFEFRGSISLKEAA